MAISLRNRQQRVHVETRWLRNLGEKALSALMREKAECSVAVVDDATMAILNHTYRGVSGPTDVLAFSMTEGRFGGLSPDLLGDVVISAETAERQARETGRDLREELAHLLIHGLLHLVGYDHGTAQERQRMWRKERAILAACGIDAAAGGRRVGTATSR
ncbi:MAG TPA: rRNA maturation RNase YbeY [Candidatus Methylomirabilis sp.]|nr:rRNA maturation RNase YbeY [Candidatus Methylomirabilis sp.]